MPNLYNLKNKKILVTGGNGQLGRALTMFLLEQGAFVYVTDIGERIDKSLQTELKNAKHKNYLYFSMDVTSELSVKKTAKEISSLDVLINNAGIAVFTPFEERVEEEIDKVNAVNIKGTILCTKVFAEKMCQKKSSSIINIASIYGVVPSDYKIYGDSGRNSSEIYAATKAGIIQMTRYFAAYLARRGIRVNSVSPGGIFNNQKEVFLKNYVRKTPLGRMANPGDIAPAVAFLVSEDARYITGQNITVDGGFTLNQ